MSAGINPPPQPDPVQAGFTMDNSTAVSPHCSPKYAYVLTDEMQFDLPSFDFANPVNGTTDVLQDFDFDSFLHNDGEGVDNFNFDTTGFGLEGEIGAD
jgi:hypothetical protein